MLRQDNGERPGGGRLAAGALALVAVLLAALAAGVTAWAVSTGTTEGDVGWAILTGAAESDAFSLVLPRHAWTSWAGAYIASVLATGLGAVALAHRRGPPSPRHAPPTSPGWRRGGLAVLAVAALVVTLRLLFVFGQPITGDEATNLEASFWSDWFLATESRSSPPLFRFLIHLTSTRPESLWLMRLPALLFGLAGIVLVYRLARRAAEAPMALAAAALVGVHGLHVVYSGEQKSYTLWLVLLLLAHGAFLDAVAGARRRWTAYAVYAALACLTHYLTPTYLLGHAAWLAFRRRDALRRGLLAMAPGLAALIPFAIPILLSNTPIIEGGGLAGGAGWWLDAAIHLLLGAGGAGVILLLLATRRFPAEASSSRRAPWDDPIPWMLVTAAAAAALFGLSSSIPARAFFPVLPFTAVYAAGRLPSSFEAWRPLRRGLVAAAGVVIALPILFGLTFTAIWPEARPGAAMHRLADAHARVTAGEAAPRITATFSSFHTLVFERTRRRDLTRRARDTPSGLRLLELNGDTLAAIPRDAPIEALRRLLRRGAADVYYFRESEYGTEQAPGETTEGWLERHCEVLAGYTNPWPLLAMPRAAVYRCEPDRASGSAVEVTGDRAPGP